MNDPRIDWKALTAITNEVSMYIYYKYTGGRGNLYGMDVEDIQSEAVLGLMEVINKPYILEQLHNAKYIRSVVYTQLITKIQEHEIVWKVDRTLAFHEEGASGITKNKIKKALLHYYKTGESNQHSNNLLKQDKKFQDELYKLLHMEYSEKTSAQKKLEQSSLKRLLRKYLGPHEMDKKPSKRAMV